MNIAVKLGGFVFKEKLEPTVVKSFAAVLRQLHERGHRLVVVAGGGANARSYIEAARSLGANEAICDLLGIYSSRLNARILIVAIGEPAAYPEVPSTVEGMQEFFSSGKIVVMGGLQPAHSTDAVAAIVAEAIASDCFIKVTDAPGVCTKDPSKYPDAKKLDQIHVDRLLELVSATPVSAGAYELIDPVAVRVIQRSRLRTSIIPGDNPRNILRAVNEENVGTKITF
ncbi:MAG: UMP kinase [archaeon]